MNKTLMYGIFYTITTVILIIYFIIEKKIEKTRKERSMKKIDNFLTKHDLFMGTEREPIVKSLDFMISLGWVIILVLFIQKFYIGNFTVPTASMEPTVIVGERFFGNMVTPKFKLPKRESIIIFREPIENKLRYTKRLVGLPGEKISINDIGQLVINGVPKTIKDNHYTQEGLIGTDTWTIPKKGDKIKLLDATFQILKNEMSLEQLQSYLKSNNGFTGDGEGISIQKMKFSINGKVQTKGLDSYVTDNNTMFKLLNGQTVSNDGYEIKILSGTFYVSKNNITIDEIKKEMSSNPKLDFRITTGHFLLNAKDATGPISDKDILTKLINGQEVTLDNNYIMALGDNTTNSSDSRYWGFVKDERILGTLLFRYWPLNRISTMTDK
ncbi:MAG: signal peptidase I [Fusobacteriaceae bacterium]|nr:signal peptidase I [Fusobacteriaceae bacterium]MBN2837691.1 signal peptidase I [Fusobacteriaceae bacterium]